MKPDWEAIYFSSFAILVGVVTQSFWTGIMVWMGMILQSVLVYTLEINKAVKREQRTESR